MVTLLEAIVTHHGLRLRAACRAVVGYLPVVGEALVRVGLGEAPRPRYLTLHEYLRQRAMYLDRMIPIGRSRDLLHRAHTYCFNSSVLLPTQVEELSCKSILCCFLACMCSAPRSPRLRRWGPLLQQAPCSGRWHAPHASHPRCCADQVGTAHTES
jgi:hypothetical protein